ncbi:hypothetical protein DSOL_5332 [Desulfosporosinus metallidurans]|uniref:Uncharacterized protein n=1 Tax=Desulfosporosinus metallidurans TaxID=1888891 RepID=A0A1Q8QDG6_9FIRM|nr:hypothetical protein DSOL_5332 [Desulfosporosinus metallidurans]
MGQFVGNAAVGVFVAARILPGLYIGQHPDVLLRFEAAVGNEGQAGHEVGHAF